MSVDCIRVSKRKVERVGEVKKKLSLKNNAKSSTIFLVKTGPNHLFREKWDIESRVRLYSVLLLVKKTMWWSAMVVLRVRF
jgi:hypothetical protein